MILLSLNSIFNTIIIIIFTAITMSYIFIYLLKISLDLICFYALNSFNPFILFFVSTDLDDLIRHGELKNLISLSQIRSTKSPTAPSPNPPAFTKERGPAWFSTCCRTAPLDNGITVKLWCFSLVGRCGLEDCDEGFFLYAKNVNCDKQVSEFWILIWSKLQFEAVWYQMSHKTSLFLII